MTRVAIEDRRLTYQHRGATRPELEQWKPPAGFRTFESTTQIGQGHADWESAAHAVSGWQVKIRSGFRVDALSDRGRSVGERSWVTLRVGPLIVREPVEVVAVVDTPDRCGFAYGTLDGHPVSGEEAFIVHRSADDAIWFTLRSLTKAPPGWWRVMYPAAVIAQRFFLLRYQRALLTDDRHIR
ncbi:MAG: hypothetical protein JWM12_3170 [Ilumatobacteraceae bacterium]|nr:hypothetical protein [Ilumatobacteraceae bacterium]